MSVAAVSDSPKAKPAGVTLETAAQAPDVRGIQMSRDNAALPNVTHSDPSVPFLLIAIDKVQPWAGNPRKHFDPVKLQELAESIKAKGVLEPLLVRPVQERLRGSNGKPDRPIGPATYEVAAGERRRRAAALAGKPDVPCIVRELSDRDMLEIAVVENEQREDTSPIEKAEGYARLIEEHHVPIEEVAARVGKSVNNIRDLLRLRRLPAKAREAVQAGELAVSVAGLVARVPSDKLRAEAAKVALEKDRFNDGALPSYRHVKSQIERRFMVELKQAPFNPAEASLLPSAGACTSCPKRTGNNRAEFPDARADVCTDPTCYQQKVEAWGKRQVAQARDSGKAVLSRKESEKLFDQWGEVSYNAPYLDLAKKCYDDRKSRTYGQIVGKDLADQVVLAFDAKGGLHKLIPKKVGEAALRKKIGSRASSSSGSDSRWKAEQAKRRTEDILKKEAARRCMGLAAAKAEQIARSNMLSVGCMMDGSQGGQLLRRCVVALVGRCWDETNRLIVVRRQLEKPKTGHAGENRSPITELALTLDPAQLVGLMAELLGGSSADGDAYYGGKESKAFWEFLGIDRKKVLSEVRKEKARGKTNGKAGKKQIRTAQDLRAAAAKAETNGHQKPVHEPDPRRGKREVANRRKLHPVSKEVDGGEDDEAWSAASAADVIQQQADRTTDPVVKKRLRRMVKDLNGEAPSGKCQLCGCTEQDCRNCFERTGQPCSWTSPAKDLCTACLPLLEADLGVLYLSQGPAVRSEMDRLAAGGLRTVGQVLNLGGTIPLPKGISGERAVELREKAMGWIKGQLQLDLPSDNSCWDCGAQGGEIAEEPGLAEDEDLVLLSKLPANIRGLYPNVPEGEDAYLCGNCIARLVRNKVMPRPKAAKAK